MSVSLDDLSACFEGVIPAVIATTAADGTPNVSYLSQVVRVDETRIALSNQFFAKTAANVRANRRAQLLLVCPRTGLQYSLDLTWETMLDHGAVFDRINRALKAAIAQTGMAHIMRLKAVDLFHVEGIAAIPSPALPGEPPDVPAPPGLPGFEAIPARVAQAESAEYLFAQLMESAGALADCRHALVLVPEPSRSVLVTAAAQGHAEAAGAEIPIGEGLIGQCAAAGTTLRINDLSRMRRMGSAVLASTATPDTRRVIPLPQLAGAMSQIAVPMVSQGQRLGVLFLESERRLAFDEAVAAGLETLARQAAATLERIEHHSDAEVVAARGAAAPPGRRRMAVKVDRFDDSVFIDDRYVIKGVAGRLLVFLLERAVAEGRTVFTNREIRRAPELRLPEFKDNLETRLLLLARRLEEKDFPVRLVRRGRGVMALQLDAEPEIEAVS